MTTPAAALNVRVSDLTERVDDLEGTIAGGTLTIKDEGVTKTTGATSIDFVGGEVAATNTGAAVTVTIPTVTAISGNAGTATALATARNIAGVSFNGTADISPTTANIADSSNKRYVTDAQLTVIGNTSGANTGDQGAGAGLTGTTTLNVIANVDGSIVANANDIQVGVLASDAQHGTRGGGSIHADVVAAGASGFMTGAQATKLAGITTGATAEVDAASAVSGRINTNATNQVLGTGPKQVDSLGMGTTAPAAPSAGVRLYSSVDARILPAFQAVTGPATPMQPFLGYKRFESYLPTGNAATTVNQHGTTTLNFGTVAGVALATTNALTAARRLTFATTASAGASAGLRNVASSPGQRLWLGNGAGLGGFHFVARFGLSVIPATRRWAVGLIATTGALANADPSSNVNCIWVGQDAADTNIQYMHNDGTSTCTKSDSGISSPATTDLVEVQIYAIPNASAVSMLVRKINGTTGAIYSASSNIPASTTFLAEYFWISNATTNAVATIDVASYFTESDA